MRDLDTSLLGQNELGLENFDHLRTCTDELVNAILHVRQLLKRRRKQSGADGEISMTSTWYKEHANHSDSSEAFKLACLADSVMSD